MSIGVRFLTMLMGLVLAAALAMACSDDDGDDEPSPVPTESPVVIGGAETPAGGGAQGGPGATATPPSPPGAPAFDEPPVTTASANGQEVEAGIGTFCWTMLCVDKIGVPTAGTLTVSRGDTVSVAIPDGTPAFREASVTVFGAVDPMPLDDGTEIWPYPGSPGEAVPHMTTDDSVDVTVDLEPGRYVLAIGMFFEPGDVVYGVLLEVQ